MPAQRIDKSALLAQLRESVAEDLAAIAASQQSTLEGATHEESRQENDKDTRALESSYLARGLAERVEGLLGEATKLAALRLRSFDGDQPAALTALVVLEDDAGSSLYFLSPAGGGKRLQHGQSEVRVVTPGSPVGRALIGKRTDDDVDLRTPGGLRQWSVGDVY